MKDTRALAGHALSLAGYGDAVLGKLEHFEIERIAGLVGEAGLATDAQAIIHTLVACAYEADKAVVDPAEDDPAAEV